MTRPTVGRIVHYLSYDVAGHADTACCRAAIIVGVEEIPGEREKYEHSLREEEDVYAVTLCVLSPTGLDFHQRVSHDGWFPPSSGRIPPEGTWHWPQSACDRLIKVIGQEGPRSVGSSEDSPVDAGVTSSRSRRREHMTVYEDQSDGFHESVMEEDDAECGYCEDEGCEQCEPDHHETHHLKFIAEGVATLPELVVIAQAQADHLRGRLEEGWRLAQPVDNGYVWLVKDQDS